MVDRFRPANLLDQQWRDAEPRITCFEGVVAGFIEPHHLVISDQHMLSLVFQDPPLTVGLVHGLLPFERSCTRTPTPPSLDSLGHHQASNQNASTVLTMKEPL